MSPIDRLALPVLHKLDPEFGHGLALTGLRLGLVGGNGPITSDRLKTTLAGIDLPNPLGLAAGFDKNATQMLALKDVGFGFLEVGAATPLPQPGNPKPRLFRLTEDKAAINRFGFNNDGCVAIEQRLAKRPENCVIGLNLGANKDTADKAQDYAYVLGETGKHLDFATVNVSSPNTAGLRDLQGEKELAHVLETVLNKRASVGLTLPVFVKIAPDLEGTDLAVIAKLARGMGLDGIIATNTTLARDGLTSKHKGETGGLSGAPLFERSTRVLAKLFALTDGKIPLIGVGGISNAEEAFAKIGAGATACQLYTALAFQGFGAVETILNGLDQKLADAGFATVADAVGNRVGDWL